MKESKVLTTEHQLWCCHWCFFFWCALRLVLSSVSDYFAAMFTSDVREARQEEIKMEGVEPNSLWSLIQYAYTGNKSENKMNVKPLRFKLYY